MYLTARASCGKCWTGAGLPCSLLCVWLFCKNGMAWDECVHVCFVCVSILSLSHVCVCAQEQACHQGVRGHGRHGESRAYSVCVVICITSERVCVCVQCMKEWLTFRAYRGCIASMAGAK